MPSSLAQSKRQLPWRLGWHLFAESAVPVFGAIAILSTTCLLLAVFDDLPDFQGSSISIGTELLYFLARALDPIETIFPFAAFLGVSFMTIVKGKNSELTAIRAAGLSLFVTALPVWLLCLALCGTEMYLTEVVRPAANCYAEQVRNDLESHKQARKQLDAKVKAEVERQLRARQENEASAPEDAQATRKTLERSVRETLEQAEKNAGASQKASSALHSLTYYNAQSRTEWFFADFRTDAPSQGVVIWKFDENGRMLSRDTAFQAEYDATTRNWRLTGGEGTQFDYPDGVELPQQTAVIRRDVSVDTVLPYSDTPQEIELLHHQPDALNLNGLLAMLRFTERLPLARRHFVKTMVVYRFFYPFSTLIAGLLGFALTLTQGRKSAIPGFVLAAVLLMVYYSMAQQAVVLGRSGILPAFVAGAVPTILALAGTLFLAWKRQ